MVSTALALVLAILAPFIWGFMNILDKFVIEHRVKSPLGFTAIAGVVNLSIGVILALFLDWSGITISDMLFPILAGVVFGLQFFLYYTLLKKEDVSSLIGFIFLYPIIVAILSFVFLHEIISLASYVGACLIIVGVILLSVRLGKVKIRVVALMLISIILIVALYEFFIKMATTELPELNGAAISCICIGLAITPVLLSNRIRSLFVSELHNAKWAVLNESLTFAGIVVTFFAMSGLPATIFSSVGAIQPLTVLLFEKIFHMFGIKVSREESFAHKILPLTLIVLGVVIIYSQELLKLFV